MRRRPIIWVLAVLGLALGATVPAGATSASPSTAAAEDVVLAGPDAPVLPSEGCETSFVAAGQSVVSMESGGVTRTYIRHMPPAAEGLRVLPVVIAFHGFAEGSVLHQGTTLFSPLGDAEGFVTIFPQGLGDPVRWDVRPGSPDVVFAGDLLDELERTLCIDTNRIYVSGYSNGAFLASQLACTYADRIAAFAPIAGLRFPTDCAPGRGVPMLSIHGTVDPLVPFAPIPGAADLWAGNNGCGAEPTESYVAGDEIADAYLLTYDCPDTAPVSYYRVENAGHGWQGSAFSKLIESVVGYTTLAISNTDIIWDFFSQQALRRDIVAYTARFDDRTATQIDRIAAALGGTPAQVLQTGVNGLRVLAEAGEAQPGPGAPDVGNQWITVTWPAAEGPAIEATAQAWGVTPAQLHKGGGLVVIELIVAAIRAQQPS